MLLPFAVVRGKWGRRRPPRQYNSHLMLCAAAIAGVLGRRMAAAGAEQDGRAWWPWWQLRLPLRRQWR